MDGYGVSNYSVDKPSFAFTTRTTEFDEALLSRNIITLEQAMVAKGASVEEAHRLAQQQQQQAAGRRSGRNNNNQANSPLSERHGKDAQRRQHANDEDDEFDDEFDDDDDDDFVAQYRQKRLQELQQQQQQQQQHHAKVPTFGKVYSITRSDWIRHVNDDSQFAWVVVLLTTSSSSTTTTTTNSSSNLDNDNDKDSNNNNNNNNNICVHTTASTLLLLRPGRRLRHYTNPVQPPIDMAMARLAVRFPMVKFVQIAAHEAIINAVVVVSSHPTMFLYRHGHLRHQLVAPLSYHNMTESQLEHELGKFGIWESSCCDDGRSVDDDDDDDRDSKYRRNGRVSRKDDNDDEDDDDEDDDDDSVYR